MGVLQTRRNASTHAGTAPNLLLLLVAMLFASGGCDVLNPNRQIETRIVTRLITPGPDVQRLLSAQRMQDEEGERFWSEKHTQQEGIERVEQLQRNPDSIYPGRKQFLSAMAAEPAELVAEHVYLRLLEDSHVKCSNPLYTTKFIKVRVTSGRFDGHVGWVCEDDVFRTVAWP
jgi:hypothetical protein